MKAVVKGGAMFRIYWLDPERPTSYAGEVDQSSEEWAQVLRGYSRVSFGGSDPEYGSICCVAGLRKLAGVNALPREVEFHFTDRVPGDGIYVALDLRACKRASAFLEYMYRRGFRYMWIEYDE